MRGVKSNDPDGNAGELCDMKNAWPIQGLVYSLTDLCSNAISNCLVRNNNLR